ncbi:class I SAM-dependent methyltransferase [Chitinophagaceae bacterium MMS25-I14]
MIATNNYDRIAKLYDRLSYLVFGRAQKRAQIELLQYIPAGSSVLIAGGGTGWVLEEIAERHSAGLDITYVEISQKMIELSRRRNIAENTVRFINEPIENVTNPGTFDVVITAFLFDNFSPERVSAVFSQLHSWVKPGGRWLFTDFNGEEARHHYWQRLMLSMMYFFFRVVCSVEAKHLVNMKPFFTDAGYVQCSHTETYGKFIFSVVYRKSLPGKE